MFYVEAKILSDERIEAVIEEMVIPLINATDELIKINKRMDEIISYADKRQDG